MTDKPLNLRQINDQLTKLQARRVEELGKRIGDLMALRSRINDELILLADEVENMDVPLTLRRRSPHVKPACGTESGYQAHRHRGENCEECKAAHAAHDRVQSARRRLKRLAS